MTVPRGNGKDRRRVTDIVRDLIPRFRYRLSHDEQQLGIYLRGNKDLFESLTGLIQSRIGGRASLPVPSDPIVCKAMLERDRELQWLLSRLEFVYKSPVSEPAEAEQGEQPA